MDCSLLTFVLKHQFLNAQDASTYPDKILKPEIIDL
jgi:hypothetical protein